MLDFIVEHIWTFVIVGVILILIAIGYIVDKFVIHKDSNDKKEENKVEETEETNVETVPEHEVPAEANSENTLEENNVVPDVSEEQNVEVTDNVEVPTAEIPDTAEVPNTEEDVTKVTQEGENQEQIPDVATQDETVKTEPLASAEEFNFIKLFSFYFD